MRQSSMLCRFPRTYRARLGILNPVVVFLMTATLGAGDRSLHAQQRSMADGPAKVTPSRLPPQRQFVREPDDTRSTRTHGAKRLPPDPREAVGAELASARRVAPTPLPTFREADRLTSSMLPPSIPVRSTFALSASSRTPAQQNSAPLVMAGFSPAALRRQASQLLDEAAVRLSHRASLTATDASTRALRMIAQAIDAENGGGLAGVQLESAFEAIREGEDFGGKFGPVDQAAIRRMVRSHRTPSLKGYDTTRLTGLMAADVYFDSARRQLASLAENDALAAHALMMLGKSYGQRATESPLAMAISVHLMRAAVQAAPDDALLTDEFATALASAQIVDPSDADRDVDHERLIHSSALASRRSRVEEKPVVEIAMLSPEQFILISDRSAGPPGSASQSNWPTSQVAEPADTQFGDAGAARPRIAPVEMRSSGGDNAGGSVSRSFRTMIDTFSGGRSTP